MFCLGDSWQSSLTIHHTWKVILRQWYSSLWIFGYCSQEKLFTRFCLTIFEILSTLSSSGSESLIGWMFQYRWNSECPQLCDKQYWAFSQSLASPLLVLIAQLTVAVSLDWVMWLHLKCYFGILLISVSILLSNLPVIEFYYWEVIWDH